MKNCSTNCVSKNSCPFAYTTYFIKMGMTSITCRSCRQARKKCALCTAEIWIRVEVDPILEKRKNQFPYPAINWSDLQEKSNPDKITTTAYHEFFFEPDPYPQLFWWISLKRALIQCYLSSLSPRRSTQSQGLENNINKNWQRFFDRKNDQSIEIQGHSSDP